MPKELEERLKREAAQKFKNIKDPKARRKRVDAYVYGTLQKVTNWKPGKKR